MSPLQTMALLFAAHAIIAVTPGPNFVLLLQTAARDRRGGFAVACGVWPAGIVLATLGLAGLGSLVAALPAAEMALRLACGGYMLWIGARMIRAARRPVPGEAAAAPALSLTQAWRLGFVTNLTNPKAIAYFASVFAATGAYALPLPWKIAAVILMPGLSFLWNCLVVALVSHQFVRKGIAGAAHWLDLVAGGIMIGFGLKLAASP